MEKLISIVSLYLTWGLMHQDYELSFDFFKCGKDCRVSCWVKLSDDKYDHRNFNSNVSYDSQSILEHLDKLL